MRQPTLARIRQDSSLAKLWQDAFGTLEVELRSPVPLAANSPAGKLSFYRVDLSKLDAQAIQKMIGHMADEFGVSREALADYIKGNELPVTAEDIDVYSYDLRAFL